jgi:3',5'-cyclic AMP phosphodiesterase CpdA
MTTIAHMSDLHFGTEDDRMAARLIEELEELRPDVTVVSGDLTQRARRRQFAAARGYLDRLPQPLVVVPGNHDIPLYDVLRRMLSPLGRYRTYISEDLCPYVVTDRLAVLGLNTARPTRWKEGAISPAQAELIRTRFAEVGEGLRKVVVTHHPFIPPPDQPKAAVVAGRTRALDAILDAGAELLLAGHLHVGYADVVEGYEGVTSMQAGTAFSRRRRSQPNAYNVIRLNGAEPQLEARAWDGNVFRAVEPSPRAERVTGHAPHEDDGPDG